MKVFFCIIINLLLCFGVSTGTATAQGFTLRQVMSAPFNEGLKAAPTGNRFLWISNSEGKRNLWIAEADKSNRYACRALTHYDQDDGQQLGDTAWLPDGSAIFYTRGGDFEFPEKPTPNPALIPAGVKQQIWLAQTSGSEPTLIAEGHSPAVSPDGLVLAYLLDGQVWTLKLQTRDAKPQQLFHGRGREDSLRWSPDSKALAFVSHREDHSFVGVYAFETNELRYLDPETFLDRQPAWSPDSRKVAFVREPPDTQAPAFGARRTGTPWSIVVADAKTGEGREIWRAGAGPGSVFRNLVAANQIAWAADGLIVFPWEQDGWSHLYSVPIAGGNARLLTPGEFDVEHVAFSPDRSTVVYSSNQQDIDRRHVWEVNVSGGPVRQLTGGDGIEVEPSVTTSNTIAVLRSDARLPIRPAVLREGGRLEDLAPGLIPAGFPAAQLIVPQPVVFSAADGMQIHGQLFLPAPAGEGERHPAIVFFHGGSRRQMLLGWHYMQYYSNAYAENQYLASLGYIVLAVNYRSGIGYGLNFREALNYGATGASEFNDVLGAGLYLRSRADVDGAHIGAWGGSYGGYLTALALSRASDLFAAGVDMHGVHDWNLEMSFAKANYRVDLDQEASKVAWESSPLSTVKGWRSPVLLMQGDDDRNVAFSQTVQLAEGLRDQGTPFEEHVFPDEIHDFLLHRTWVAAYGYEADFFGRYLKLEKPH